MSLELESVLTRLAGVRRNGDGWVARCPAHEDHNPSLSIHERDGKVLLHCHAGCTVEAICAALGIDMRDLFNDGEAEPRIVAEYGYTDEEESLLYQVIRFDPKDFRQRRPDGRGGWTWNLQGVRRVPYRLPEVLTTKSVLVCEGEKDCETARKISLAATCNAGGAGKWREEYSEYLRERRIAIIADADEPGRKHAQQVAASLFGKAESVKVLELPGAKDLTEWVEHGGTRDELLKLIRGTPEWRPQPTFNADGFLLTRLGDLMGEPEESVSWLLAGILPSGGLSLLAAKPKAGKSTLARCLALSVARGEVFLGRDTQKGAVVYLALEEKRSEVRRHFRTMGATGDEEIYVHAAHAPAEALGAITIEVKARKPVLLIIDPLLRFTRVKDGNDYAQVTAALEPLLILARQHNVHVLLVHHAGKGERSEATDGILGSTALFAAVDTALIMKRSDKCRTVQSRQRYGEDLAETLLEFNSNTRTLALGVEKSQADLQAIACAALGYLQTSLDPKTEDEILEAVEGRTGLKRKVIRTLVVDGTITRAGSGKKGDPYKYSVSRSQDIAGTREQESQNGSETRVNTGDILVPTDQQKSILVPEKIEVEL
jgi:hypothetical protein